MRYVKNRTNWLSGRHESIRDPLGGLNPSLPLQLGGIMEVHNTSDSLKEEIKIGARYLKEASQEPTREEYRESAAKYIDNKLKPVLESLTRVIDEGAWDYPTEYIKPIITEGQDHDAYEASCTQSEALFKKDLEENVGRRNKQKIDVKAYLASLIESYQSSPNDIGAEEMVMMHAVLSKMPIVENQGSPFTSMIETIVSCIEAYSGESTSCKKGIKERFVLTAAVMSGELSDVEAVDNSYDAMQAYIREYMNAYEIDGNLSPLMMDMASFYIAKHIYEQDTPSNVTVEDAYDAIESRLKGSLADYIDAIEMPWVCAVFERSHDKQLKQKIVQRLTSEHGFFGSRAEEIADGEDDASYDLELAQKGLNSALKKQLINRFIQDNPPGDYRNWSEFNGDKTERKDRISKMLGDDQATKGDLPHDIVDALHLKEIAEGVNEVLGALSTGRNSLGLTSVTVSEKDIFKELSGLYDISTGILTLEEDIKTISYDMTRHYFHKALASYTEADPVLFSCFSSSDISDDDYGSLKAILVTIDQGRITTDLIRAVIDKSYKTEDSFISQWQGDQEFSFVCRYGSTKLLYDKIQSASAEQLGEMLLIVTELGNNKAAKAILTSPHYTADVFLATAHIALHEALDSGNLEIMHAILASQNCTTDVLLATAHIALHEALDSGNPEIVNAILASQNCTTDVLLATNAWGNTELHHAVDRGNTEVINAILGSPHCTVDVLSATNRRGEAVLHLAVESRNAEILNSIVTSAHCTNDVLAATDVNGNTVLHLAVSSRRLARLNVILLSPHCTAEVLEKPDNRGQTALHLAAESINPEVINAILASEHCTADVLLATNQHGETALHLAAESINPEVINAILASEHCTADVLLATNKLGNTALHVAGKSGNTEIINAIVTSTPCTAYVLLATDGNGDTAAQTVLHKAISSGNAKEINAILSSALCTEGLLSARTKEGDTALHAAVSSKYPEIVNAILASPLCTVDELVATNWRRETALQGAVLRGNPDMVKAILESTHCIADVFLATDKYDCTVLHSAVLSRNPEIINALLTYTHCTVDVLLATNRHGYTVLHLAVESENLEIINAIIASPHCTADVLSATNRRGEAALDLALGSKNSELITMLAEACDQKGALGFMKRTSLVFNGFLPLFPRRNPVVAQEANTPVEAGEFLGDDNFVAVERDEAPIDNDAEPDHYRP